MRCGPFANILALLALTMPVAAWASPEAPSTPEELEADRAYIRSLNLRELAYVQQRDAARAREQAANLEAQENYQEAYDDFVRSRADYLQRRGAYEGAMESYSRQRLGYENRMSEWRRKVAACRAGDDSACDR